MATGKVKKMAFGGMGKQPANALRPMQNSAKAAPMRTQSQMQNAVKQDMNSKAAQFQKAGTTFGKPGGSQSQIPAFARPYANKMMSAARTQSQMQGAAKPKMGLGAAMANPKTTSATRTQSQMQDAANKQYAALRGTMASPRGMMKKGGAVKKKATKK